MNHNHVISTEKSNLKNHSTKTRLESKERTSWTSGCCGHGGNLLQPALYSSKCSKKSWRTICLSGFERQPEPIMRVALPCANTPFGTARQGSLKAPQNIQDIAEHSLWLASHCLDFVDSDWTPSQVRLIVGVKTSDEIQSACFPVLRYK